MLTKNELKVLWRKAGFRPLKRMGQNFLIDKNVKDKILRNVKIGPDDTVLEIGPGFGEMTSGLAERAKRVVAVEKDKKIAGCLKKDIKLPGNVSLIEGDFLEVDIKKLAAEKKIIVYGNLPYYATTPILERLFNNITRLKNIYLIVQREVARRIAARPGSKEIGRLSMYAQYYTDPGKAFTIFRGCFYPVPKVESVFLNLEIPGEKKITVKNEKLLFKVIKTAYGQRRKTVLNSLAKLGIEKKMLLPLMKSAGINPRSRPEEISLQEFACLTRAMAGGRKTEKYPGGGASLN